MKAKKLVRNFAVMGAYLILYGISFLIIILSTTSLDWNFTNLAYIVLAFIIAWLCGLVVIGAPGGIGIREVVLLFLLKNIISEADLVLAVVLHRFCTIAADVISFLLVNIREKFKGLVYGQKKI